MAEASRFPHLALPFAIAGAAGGWLSATLVSNPAVQRFQWDVRAPAVVAGATFTALAGWVITRWCTAEEPPWSEEMEELRPRRRPLTKRWPAHAIAVITAGALAGASVAIAADVYAGAALGALVGAGCALAFVPVCLAVLAAAKRAERARLGSLVSDSDRRAVWGILATALALASLEALPGWPAANAGEAPLPWPAIGMLIVCGTVIGGVLAADARGRRRARRALATGLEPQDPSRLGSADTRTPRIDLGLGEGLAAHMARSTSAYRGQDRPLALVQGDASLALPAFRRALVRGALGLAIVGVAGFLHFSAQDVSWQLAFHERRCERFGYRSCHLLADIVRGRTPDRAMALYEKACGLSSPESCVSLANMYLERGEVEKADALFGRACRFGHRGGCLGTAR